MDCQVVQKMLQFYLDGEFDEEDRWALEQHLASCPDCRARADYEHRFRRAVRARVALPAAPDGLRQRAVELVEQGPTPRRVPRRLIWGTVPAAAALALVVSFTWAVTSGFMPLIDEAVVRHSRQPPVEVDSADSGVVEDWFRSKVDFHVALPRFERRQLALVGARLSNLAERQAALVRYRHGGRQFSLFVISDSGVDIDGQHCRRVQHREYCLSELRGYTVASWRARGLVYSMVGESSQDDLLRVLAAIPDR
jgi:anti-sigma factor (TIGR02949 family)